MYSTPWGAPDRGPCDKCGQTGQTTYRCRSCLARGADEDCPACHGRVQFLDQCPACEGTGSISRTTRDGVSVFPTIEGLRRYLAERDAEPCGHGIVVLAGEITGDVDLDADAGAVLIHPTDVLGWDPLT